MAKDAFTISGWYLRRVPLLAVAALFVAAVNLWAYNEFGNGVNLFCGSLMVGMATLVVAREFAELNRYDSRPRTAREQDQERERVSAWYRSLSDRERDQVDQLARQLRTIGRSGITAGDAAHRLARFR